MNNIHFKTAKVDGLNVFYREAGKVGQPKLLLLMDFLLQAICSGT